MDQTVEQRHGSAEERYATSNFQRRADLAAVQEILQTPETAARPVLLLSGPEGIGRGYLLAAAVWRLQQAGLPIAYLALDLTGYVEGPEGIRNFVDFQAERWDRRGRPVAAEAIPWIQEHADRIADDLGGAATAALLLAAAGSLPGWPRPESPIPSPRRPSLEALGHLLGQLTRNGTVLLHVTDSSVLNTALRSWLLREARRHPRLALAFSCQARDAAESVAPGAATRRLEIAPLDRSELQAVLDDLYPSHRFPPELAAELESYSRGWPARTAAKLQDLVDAGLLVSNGGVWTLGGEGLRSPAGVEQLRSTLYGLRELRAVSEPLDRFLQLAALCGEFVPADLVIAHLGLTQEERDELLDRIDEELLVGEDAAVPLFRDYQYEHPSFSGLLTYGFADPFFRWLLVEEIAEQNRPRLAAALLEDLHRAPAGTRDLAKVFLSLAGFLGNPDDDSEAEAIRSQLADWVGGEEAEILAREIATTSPEGRESGDLRRDAATLHQLAGALAQRGEVGRADELWSQSLPLCEAIGDPLALAATLSNLAWAAGQQGDAERQRAFYLRAARAWVAVGAWADLVSVLWNLGASNAPDALAYLAQAFWLATIVEVRIEGVLSLTRALLQKLGPDHAAAPLLAGTGFLLVRHQSAYHPEAGQLVEAAAAPLTACAQARGITEQEFPDWARALLVPDQLVPALRQALEEMAADSEWLFDRAVFESEGAEA